MSDSYGVRWAPVSLGETSRTDSADADLWSSRRRTLPPVRLVHAGRGVVGQHPTWHLAADPPLASNPSYSVRRR